MIPIGAPSRDQTRPIELVAVGLAAFVVRLVVVMASAESGLFSDMLDYDVRARLLMDGKPLPDSFRGPGYPLWLALLYSLPGNDHLTARIGNAVLGAATSVLTAILAREFAGRRAALAAALVVALYPASVLFSVYLLSEGLYGLLVLATLVTARRVSVTRTAASGVLTGLAALTRSLGIVMVPALWAGYLREARSGRGWAHAGAQCALLAVTCVITLGPWLSHTSRVSGGVMLDSSSAVNVLLGNNPRARERLEHVDFNWVWEAYLGGTVDEADRNARALEQSWNWMRSNPAAWLRLAPLKMAYLWGIEGREHAWAYSNAYFGERDVRTVRVWGVLLLMSFPVLALFAVVGLMRPGLLDSVSGTHLVVILAITTVLHVISFSETRFHLPLVPILAVLAARGMTTSPPMTRTRWAGALLVGFGLAAGWGQQIPELLRSYAQLTAPEGWKTMLPF